MFPRFRHILLVLILPLTQPFLRGEELKSREILSGDKKEIILPWLGRVGLFDAPYQFEKTDLSGEKNEEDAENLEGKGNVDLSPREDSKRGEQQLSSSEEALSLRVGNGPGEISGTVSDAQGKSIANVIITLPDLGGVRTQTAPDGSFRITGLPSVEVRAEFLKEAYQSKVELIRVRETGVTKLNVPLELKPVELADGEYLLETEEVVLEPLEEEAAAPGITVATGVGLTGGGLSKDFLSKAGAGDAAGAVEKISGANVVGGKFVVVRGLGDRYNNTTLNGGIVPSPETSRKAVQLDLFPSNALEAVAIKKTAAPSLPADFVGGLVQLQTLTEADEDFFKVSVGSTFDSITQSHGKFFTVPGLELSSDLTATNQAPLPSLRTNASGAEAKRQRQAFFDAVKFNARENGPRLDQNISASFSKTWELDGNSELNLLGTIGRSGQQRYQKFEQSRFQNAIELKSGFGPSDLNPRFADLGSLRQFAGLTVFDGLIGNFQQESYRESEEFSALVAGSLNIGDNLELNGSYFNFRSGNATYTLIDNGVTNLADFDLESESDALARGQVYLDNDFEATSYRQIYDLIYRELQFGQIGGSYRFDDWREGARVTWNAYQSETAESSPRTYELRGYFLTELNNDVDPISGISIPNPANIANPNSSNLIQFETLDDSAQFKLDGVLPLIKPTTDRKVNLFGGFGQYRRDRESDTNAAIIASGGSLTSVAGGISATERLLNDEEVGTANSIQSVSGFVPGSSALGVTPTYFGSNLIDSLYTGLDLEYESWFALGGLRFEEETRAFKIPGGRRGISQTIISDDIYPSFQLGRFFGTDREIEAKVNYSDTVVRPSFYEFIPARILDLTNQRIFVGNRDLRETKAQNFDFSLNWKRENNYAGINLFHKIITDPIFTINDPSGVADRTFVNLGETDVSGVELEGSYDLGAGFSVTGNLSFIEASAQPGNVRINRQDFLGQIDRLEGQPEMLGNFILSWESEDIGLSTNLIYTYTGEYLTVASLGFVGQPDSALPNEIRKPFHSLDWNISKKWESSWADYKVKFQVRNILDSDVEVFYEGLASTIAPAEAVSPGREFGLSLEAKF